MHLHRVLQILDFRLLALQDHIEILVCRLGIEAARLLIFRAGVVGEFLVVLHVAACLVGTILDDEVLQALAHGVGKRLADQRVLCRGGDRDDARFLVHADAYVVAHLVDNAVVFFGEEVGVELTLGGVALEFVVGLGKHLLDLLHNRVALLREPRLVLMVAHVGVVGRIDRFVRRYDADVEEACHEAVVLHQVRIERRRDGVCTLDG